MHSLEGDVRVRRRYMNTGLNARQMFATNSATGNAHGQHSS